MKFPVLVSLGLFKIHPHFLFDLLAYVLGTRLYFLFRRKEILSPQDSFKIAVGAIIGAALGSVSISLFLNPQLWLAHDNSWPKLIFQGKTVVGGILGGLMGVELTKKIINCHRSTGDDFVFPLIAGMIVGRIGCFLTGLTDNTHGTVTRLPWGIDFGDGLRRHPTQLYDILFLTAFSSIIYLRKKMPHEEGDMFKLFVIGYLAYRFFIDFLKPYPNFYVGLNMIQLACVAGIAYYWAALPRLLLIERNPKTNAA